jgi:hypothetical protein
MPSENDTALPSEIVRLLREVHRHDQDVTGLTRADFLFARGKVQDALIYSGLFAPQFIEVEGFILLAEFGVLPKGGLEQAQRRITEALKISADEARRFVDSCNWVEVPYLLSDNQSSDAEDNLLARAIADAWQGRLNGLYHDRSFQVQVFPKEETGSVVGVGFREITKQS